MFPVPSRRPDAALALTGSFGELPSVWTEDRPRPEKRYLRVSGGASEERPWPLAAIYVLGTRGPASQPPEIEALDRRLALPTLMLHRHMAPTFDRAAHERDFAVLARLADDVPVRALIRPEGVHTVPRTADVILDDVSSLT